MTIVNGTDYNDYELQFYAEILATTNKFETLQDARNLIVYTQQHEALSTDEAGKFLLKKYNMKVGQ